MYCHGLKIIIDQMVYQLVESRKSKGNYITTRNEELIM